MTTPGRIQPVHPRIDDSVESIDAPSVIKSEVKPTLALNTPCANAAGQTDSLYERIQPRNAPSTMQTPHIAMTPHPGASG